MTTKEMNFSKKTARIAGGLYLLLIIFGVFAELFVRMELVVPGDASTTAANIMNSETLFRVGFVCDIIMSMLWIFLAFAIYQLLKPVNKTYVSMMLLFVMAGVAMQLINLLNQYAVLLLLSGDEYLSVFEADQLNALAMFFINLHNYGYILTQIFHGLWLLPIGLTFLNSDYLPRILGIFLVVASISFIIDVFSQFLIPGYEFNTSIIVLLPTVIAEFSLCGWLLVKGVIARQPTAIQPN